MVSFKDMKDKYPDLELEIQVMEDYINNLPLRKQIKALEQIKAAFEKKIEETEQLILEQNEEEHHD